MIEKPLSDFLRPTTLNDLVGQEHLLGKNSVLRRCIANGNLPSLILWGPPGSGKTTLAKLLVSSIKAELITISAVLAGVKEIRSAIEKAHLIKENLGTSVVFVDEVHRFNKAQQDAFLPHIESGLFIFIGATTENPGFEINSALCSRSQILVLKSLNEHALAILLDKGLRALNLPSDTFTGDAKDYLVANSDGDGRRLLNILESVCANLNNESRVLIGLSELKKTLPHVQRSFDKKGDQYYDQISAFHKSVRGSNPDAALYWMNRMIDGGIDPKYLSRRMIRIASEDVGLADPRALTICIAAAAAFDRLGSPEGELALAEAAIFLSVAAKSNAAYKAFSSSKKFVGQHQSDPVPMHLRNASTSFSEKIGYGKDYNYSHDNLDGVSPNQSYFPDCFSKSSPIFYEPVSRGMEIKIGQKLISLREKKTEIK